MRTIDVVDLAQLGGEATTINIGFADDPRFLMDPPLQAGERLRFVELQNLQVEGTLQLGEAQGRPYWTAMIDPATIRELS